MSVFDDVYYAVPTREKPTVLSVSFSRHCQGRFRATVSKVRLYRDNTIGGSGFAATAQRDPAYFAALDAWLPEQDWRRPFAERLREFARRYAAGQFGTPPQE